MAPPRSPAVDKAALRAELAAQLEAALAIARAAHAAALEGATHAEARAENPKDTRGLEQSYLARGQAQRVAELEAGLAAVQALALRAFAPGDPIALGALVTLADDTADDDDDDDDDGGGGAQRLFLVPAGGGAALAGGVQAVTPSSPLGRAVLGKQRDDDVELRLPGRVRTLQITAVG